MSDPKLSLDVTLSNRPALVCAHGPNFYHWLGSPVPEGAVFYGCGRVSRSISLDVYACGDSVHFVNIPREPGVLTYATPSVIDGCPKGTLLYEGSRLPHGGSSGGMAISLAADRHQTIFLAGFDGWPEPSVLNEIVFSVIRYWRDLGREFLSLTPTVLDVPFAGFRN